MQLTPHQMLAEALRNGRRWTRSFQGFRPTIEGMITAGEVHRVAPEPGKGRNMVELTGRGWAVYFGEDMVVSRLDQFAELLSMGFSVEHAGHELNLTPGQTAAAFRDIKAQVGAQAA